MLHGVETPDLFSHSVCFLLLLAIGLTNGQLSLKCWQFHFYHSADHPMEIILIQQQGKGLSKKAAKPMWLAWIGEEKLSLEELWKYYLRRFAIEHWNRFLKQRLHWTKPQLGSMEKGQRWSDLMTIATWQLWLAREIIEDNPLPGAKTSTKREINIWKGCPELQWSFSRHRHSGFIAQTPWKVPWLAQRQNSH